LDPRFREDDNKKLQADHIGSEHGADRCGHSGGFTDSEFIREPKEVQAGAAGKDRYALLLKLFEVGYSPGTLRDEFDAGIPEHQGRRLFFTFRQPGQEVGHNNLTQLIIAAAEYF
jgi:hypothetical protein